MIKKEVDMGEFLWLVNKPLPYSIYMAKHIKKCEKCKKKSIIITKDGICDTCRMESYRSMLTEINNGNVH